MYPAAIWSFTGLTQHLTLRLKAPVAINFYCGRKQEFQDLHTRTDLAYAAAYLGQTECLRVIHAQGIVLNGEVSYYAIGGGQLDSLRLAHELGDVWHTHTAGLAARQGTGQQSLASNDDIFSVVFSICVKESP